MQLPVISIIVPVRNTKDYLINCLDTLKAQTLCSLEVLIIDDCSEQDIAAVVSPYLADARFQYYRLNQNLGPGGARNLGLEKASGKYVGFCDSDDWVDLDFYDVAVGFMEQSDADIGMCSIIREIDGTRFDKTYKCQYNRLVSLSSDMAIKIMTEQLDAGIKISPFCTNKIYKKDFLEHIHARFKEHMYFQDVLFAWQTFLKAEQLICIPGVRYHHFKRSNSIIQSFNQKHIDDFCRLFLSISAFLKAEGLYDCYRYNYYKLCEYYYDVIIGEIFQFVQSEDEKKKYLCLSLDALKKVLTLEEYLEYTTAEKLYRHLRSDIQDTILY